MKNLLITIALMLGFAVTAQAQDYTLDFVAEAAGNERAEADGTRLLINGIYVEFSATSTDGEGYAYFDDVSGGKDAGLGVCTTISNTQCDPSSDDNLTFGETLTLSFWDQESGGIQLFVELSDMVFRNGAHDVISGSFYTILFAVGGTVTDSDIVSLANGGPSGRGYEYTFGFDGSSAVDGTQYYISSMLVSEVPEPATWLMMIIGFGIVSATARRSRRHSGSIIKTC